MSKATNITWHEGAVSRADRERLLGQRGVTVWMTGLSGSGKSTVGVIVEKMLIDRGRLVYRLDGDNVRHGLNSNLGFGADDRAENIRRIGEVAKLFTDAGVIVIASFISPYRKDRDGVRAKMPAGLRTWAPGWAAHGCSSPSVSPSASVCWSPPRRRWTGRTATGRPSWSCRPRCSRGTRAG